MWSQNAPAGCTCFAKQMYAPKSPKSATPMHTPRAKVNERSLQPHPRLPRSKKHKPKVHPFDGPTRRCNFKEEKFPAEGQTHANSMRLGARHELTVGECGQVRFRGKPPLLRQVYGAVRLRFERWHRSGHVVDKRGLLDEFLVQCKARLGNIRCVPAFHLKRRRLLPLIAGDIRI